MENYVSPTQEISTTTTLEIAKGVGTNHKYVMALLDKYREGQNFLNAPCEILTKKTASGGGRPTRYAVLTEPQTSFLLMLMANSPAVMEFKRKFMENFRRVGGRVGMPVVFGEVSERVGHLYVLENPTNSLCKIGRSVNPEVRMSGIATQAGFSPTRTWISPPLLEYGKFEALLLLAFEDCRGVGEWVVADFDAVVKKGVEISKQFVV